MQPFDPLEHNFRVNRRQFFRQNAMGLGGIALGSLLAGGVGRAFAAGAPAPESTSLPRPSAASTSR